MFNISRNFVSRSSVEDMQVCPRFKFEKCLSLKLDSLLDSKPSIELEELFQPRDLTATRQIGYLSRFMKNRISDLF